MPSGNVSSVSVTSAMGTVVPPAKPLLRSTWTTVGRMNVKSRSTWETTSSLTVQKSCHFRVTDDVTKSIAVAFNSKRRLSVFKTSRFNVYTQVRTFSTSRFNTLFKVAVRDWSTHSASPGLITGGIVHPIDFSAPSFRRTFYGLAEPIVSPIDYQVNVDSGNTTQPGIQFRVGLDPNGVVVCQRSVRYNVLNTVSNTQKSSWQSIYRYGLAKPMLFNIYNNLSSSVVSQWIVGPKIPGHIRQMAQVRMDFAY